MNDKKFTGIVLIVFGFMTMCVVGFNYWIDPMWHYAHAHEFNDVQKVINEREQKTAELLFQEEEYDTILIGSSRSTYIPPKSFGDWNVYNFSVSNLSMREYQSMIQYTEDISNQPIERYIIGVDFFKSSEQEASIPRSIVNFENKIKGSFYRTKSLLSLDLLEYSIDNYQLSRDNLISEDRLYNRENTAFAKKLTEQQIQEETADKIIRFKDVFYGENYIYYTKYKEIMAKVNQTGSSSEKIIYTTPISTELFTALVETGLLDDYEIWIRDLVDVYGGVWNFMYPNTVTNDITNYFDGHHFYPEVGNLIALRISNASSENLPEDFGEFISEKNLEEHLAKVRILAERLD